MVWYISEKEPVIAARLSAVPRSTFVRWPRADCSCSHGSVAEVITARRAALAECRRNSRRSTLFSGESSSGFIVRAKVNSSSRQ